MKKNKLKKKALVLLAAIAVMLLLPQHLSAQDGGLFGLGSKKSGSTENYGLMGRGSTYEGSINSQDFGTTPNGSINVEDFQAPLGSGAFFLLAASIGYSCLKRKKKNQ